MQRALSEIPVHDVTLDIARLAAAAYARHAKGENTRRAWCDWCHTHALPCLPAHAGDVVGFLAAERGRGLSVTTVELRRAAIRYLHFLAGCAVPTAEAHVAASVAGMRRHAADAGELPAKKLAAMLDTLRGIIAQIPSDLPGLRDCALLLLGFAGALRGLRLTLPRSKGERGGRAVTVAIPYGRTRAVPGARGAALAGGGRDQRGRAVPAHLDPADDGRAPCPAPASAARRSIPAPSPASSRSAPPPPASSATGWPGTASSAGHSPPGWTRASTRPGSSSSAGTRATPCSTTTCSSATRSTAIRSPGCSRLTAGPRRVSAAATLGRMPDRQPSYGFRCELVK
jgi:hypothetical protein